ncbi:MAG: amidase [Minwuia sp.]|nr:amidase [Minwuia sp.]
MLDQGLGAIAAALAAGKTTAAELVESSLDAATRDQGPTAIMTLHAGRARAEAEAIDAMRKAGREARPLAGIPFTIKDLFDEQGHVTTAGSKALSDTAPAAADAPAVARLRRAGLVIIGRTVMTEFAYSGLGLNPHYGTPLSPWDRQTGRIPGGSTSGGAVSVADGMAAATLGTDTGGSCRIPAAFCGLTGFKPTQARVPLTGATPLSHSLDSIGPLAWGVDCCATLDDILAGGIGQSELPRDPRSMTFLAPTNSMLDGMDDTVAAAMDAARQRLTAAGVRIVDTHLPELDELPGINAAGGFAAADSFAWHRDLIARRGETYDPRVIGRIQRGAAISAADYIDLMQARQAMMQSVALAMRGYDAMLTPTVPVVPPALHTFDGDDDAYTTRNLLCLRNPSVGNFLNCPSISLPCHHPDEAPVGLMLTGLQNHDRVLFQVAAGVEAVLRG